MNRESPNSEIGRWAWRLLPLILGIVGMVYLLFAPALSDTILKAGIASQEDDWWIVDEFTGKPL